MTDTGSSLDSAHQIVPALAPMTAIGMGRVNSQGVTLVKLKAIPLGA
jgi:hypothetical protein